MTTPNFDYLRQQVPNAPVVPSTTPTFDYLRPQPIEEEKKEPTAWERLHSTVNNLAKLANVSLASNPQTMGLMGAGGASDLGEFSAAAGQVAPNSLEFSAARAAADIRDIFKKVVDDPSKSFSDLWTGVKKTTIADLAVGIPEGMLRMPLSVVESATGVSFKGERLEAMLPEERSASIKEAVGNIVGLAAGGVASKAFESAMIARGSNLLAAAAADQSTTSGLAGFVRSIPKGNLARKISKGLIEGSAFGSAQSAFAYANTDEQLTQMLMNGVVFAPLGAALELVHGKKLDRIGDTLVRKSFDVLMQRQVEFTLGHSLNDVAAKIEILKSADNMAEAVMKQQLELGQQGVAHIVGINNATELVALEQIRENEFSREREARVAEATEKQIEQYRVDIEKINQAHINEGNPNETTLQLTNFGTPEPVNVKFATAFERDLFKRLYENDLDLSIDNAKRQDNFNRIKKSFVDTAEAAGVSDLTIADLYYRVTWMFDKMARDLLPYETHKAFGPDTNSFKEGYGNVDFTQAPYSLLGALSSESHRIGQIKAATNLKLTEEWEAKKLPKVAVHTNSRGVTSALFYNADAPEHIKKSIDFYKRYGFVKDEVVSVNGKDMVLRDTESMYFNLMQVEDPLTGKTINVDIKDVIRKASGPSDVQTVSLKSIYNLKGRFIKELRDKLRNSPGNGWGRDLLPMENEATAAWGNAEHGKPVSAPAWRQQRGPAIGKTGRFYGSNAMTSGGYAPGGPGREIEGVGKLHTLVIHRLEFKNPVVIEAGSSGAHNTVNRLLRDPNSWLRKALPNVDPKLLKALEQAHRVTRTTPGESGYQLQDVILAKIFKDAGHDGIVYKKGSRTSNFRNTEVVDLRGTGIMDNRTSVEALTLGRADEEVMKNRMYDRFREQLVFAAERDEMHNAAMDLREAENNYFTSLSDNVSEEAKAITKEAYYKAKERHQKSIRSVENKYPDSKFPKKGAVDYIFDLPKKSFGEHLNEFTAKMGFNQLEAQMIGRDFERRLRSDLSAAIDPDEKVILDRITNEANAELDQRATVRRRAQDKIVNELAEIAHNNGFYIDKEDADNLIVRDSQTDKIMGKFKKVEEADQWIKDTGQANGIDLDGGNGNALPPRITGMPNPSGMPDHPNAIPDFHPLENRMAHVTSHLNSLVEWLTPNRGVFAALDQKFSQYKTDFFNKIFDKGQTVIARRNAELHPWYDRLKKVEESLGNMSLAAREKIAQYMETMAPGEIEARGGRGGAPLTDLEKGVGRWLANNNIDITNVFKYRRGLAELKESFGVGTPEYDAAHADMKTRLGMDTKHLEAYDKFSSIIRKRDGSGLGPAVRYARSIMNGDVDRPTFAAKHKMNGTQLKAAAELLKLQEDLAVRFNIDAKDQLSNYMTHARLYENGKISDALDYYGGKTVASGAEDFYAALTRTGEIDAYETDPIRAIQRYIKAGMDHEILKPVIDEMNKSIVQELIKLPDNVREKTQVIVKRYVTDIQGIPNAADRYAQQTVDSMFNKLGIESSVDLRRGIINFLSASFEAGAQGFRLIAGLRDFSTGLVAYYSRFGAKRTGEMLRYGVTGYGEVTRKSLADAHIIPTLTPIYFDTPTDMSGRAIGRATNKIGQMWRAVTDKGLAVSGQRAVYGMFHAGSFIETWKRAGDNINQFRAGKIKWEQVQKNLGLQMYDDAVQKGFQDHITAGRYEEAAQYLGRQTGAEVIGVFGMANHPSGWNRNIGRIAGQFGSWSMFHRTYLQRLMSQGTYGQRFAAMSRLAATQAVLYGIAKGTGVNLWSWSAPQGVMFGGGPMIGLMEDMNDYMNRTGYEQTRALQKLTRTLSLLVPGIQVARDIGAASEMSDNGETDATVIGRGLGFRQLPPEQ